jgi:integrase/recombinase XerD
VRSGRSRAGASVRSWPLSTCTKPRLHDFRHCFAVRRLPAWYHAGADVQRLLPHLATDLGHADLAGTQRYLTLTPELLTAASQRVAAYALERIFPRKDDTL